MKLSVLPVSLFSSLVSGEMTIAQWAAYAQSRGADGFDVSSMFFPNHTATTIHRIKQELAAENITIQPVMACCYPDFTNPDKAERDRQVDYLIRDLALISDFGFRYCRITAGQNHPDMDFQEAVNRCVDCFSRVTGAAERYGVKLVFENHSKPGAWPLIDFSFDPNAFLAVCEKMKGLPVGINFDTANAAACGADPAALLEQVIDRVWTVHMNDTLTVGKWTPVSIGEGLVDYDAVFSVLNRHHFDGWVCIEEASGNGLQGIDQAIRVARRYVK